MTPQMTLNSLVLPSIIQGGMGVGVSNWRLARAVSQTGQLGVVSGTALATVLARRLQTGDVGGHMRDALAAFPLPKMANRILERYFVPGGKTQLETFRNTPMPNLSMPQTAELTVVGNFVEVFLAKQGHGGIIGLNLLEKIQIPTLASLFGAMLAGVDYILMGAGIPRAIPRILDLFASGQPAELKINVQGAGGEDDFTDRFDPRDFGITGANAPRRPAFLGIVSSNALAKTLVKRTDGKVDGLVIEGPTAGGHNAPPRGPVRLSESGEPVFGQKDEVDIEQIRALDLPFWLAGSYGRPGKLSEARALGATGIQAGTAFAFCEESGLSPGIKTEALRQSLAGETRIFTDPQASPTGFPFKTLKAKGTLSEEAVYNARERICDLGYLRTPYRRDDGTLGFRCPGEPEAHFIRKGGEREATQGRKCVCNGLMAAIGLGQVRHEIEEPVLLTAGEDSSRIADFLSEGKTSYSAADVVSRLSAAG